MMSSRRWGGGADSRGGTNTDVEFKAERSGLVLYFPQTHDLLKDLALSAAVANHLKQRNDRLSQEGKLSWRRGKGGGVVWI